jgi:hypothetical protein
LAECDESNDRQRKDDFGFPISDGYPKPAANGFPAMICSLLRNASRMKKGTGAVGDMELFDFGKVTRTGDGEAASVL